MFEKTIIKKKLDSFYASIFAVLNEAVEGEMITVEERDRMVDSVVKLGVLFFTKKNADMNKAVIDGIKHVYMSATHSVMGSENLLKIQTQQRIFEDTYNDVLKYLWEHPTLILTDDEIEDIEAKEKEFKKWYVQTEMDKLRAIRGEEDKRKKALDEHMEAIKLTDPEAYGRYQGMKARENTGKAWEAIPAVDGAKALYRSGKLLAGQFRYVADQMRQAKEDPQKYIEQLNDRYMKQIETAKASGHNSEAKRLDKYRKKALRQAEKWYGGHINESENEEREKGEDENGERR